MPKMLSEATVRQFHDHGYFSPVPVLGGDEVKRYRQSFTEFETREGGKLKGGARNKSHLFLRWLYEIVTHTKILDVAEDLIGPNILLYHAQWFIKEPHTPDFVSLHQDTAYWSLTSPEGFSAWVAFEDCDAESGCMCVIPDTHKSALVHVEQRSPENMLFRGQTVASAASKAATVEMPLRAGEMSLHHARIVHGSGPNLSSRRRIGYSIRYIPTHVGRTGPRDSAMLVRGTDAYHHFDPEPAPVADYDPAAVKFHTEMNRQYMEHYMTAKPELVG